MMSVMIIAILLTAVFLTAVWESRFRTLENKLGKERNIKFKLLSPASTMPVRGTLSAAGIDFFAAQDVLIRPGESVEVPLGVAWEPDGKDLYLQLKGRSGLAFKHGIEASNAGVVDADYRGEIKARLRNDGDEGFWIRTGARCCQGIVISLPSTVISQADELNETVRGANGFGSTGV